MPASAEAALFRFQGQAASAILLFVQPGDTEGSLILTEVVVSALSGRIQVNASQPAAGTVALVLVSQVLVEGLTSTPLFLFVGALEGAPVTFDAGFPTVPTAAALSAAIPGIDLVSGMPTTVTLDMMWLGSGSPVHVNGLTRATVDGIVLTERTNGFVRPMTTVLATIAGTPVPIAAPPGAPAAVLGSFNTGAVAVS